MQPFPCTACGKCCRNIRLSTQTTHLDRGDGICQFLDEQTNLCTTYDSRPLFCRVDEYYLLHYKDKYSWDDFIKINLEICQKL